MKKSRAIQLVLITSLLAYCNKRNIITEAEWLNKQSTYAGDNNPSPYLAAINIWGSSFHPAGKWDSDNEYMIAEADSAKGHGGGNLTKSSSSRGGFGRSHSGSVAS